MTENEPIYKQIFIVNKDLKMDTGKIAGQCCHGETLYMDDVMLAYHQDDSLYNRYEKWKRDDIKPIGLMKKIILKASEQEIQYLISEANAKNVISYTVYDKGLTQIEEGSLSCVCFEPVKEDIANQLFGHLKLL